MSLSEKDWKVLLDRISLGKCTPFLGAGVNDGLLPLGHEIATKWAQREGFPFEPSNDLLRVAQFLAIKYDGPFPKEQLSALFRKRLRQANPEVSLRDPKHPLAIMASLPVPVYITTNYDDLLTRALREQDKTPQAEICRWNHPLQQHDDGFRVEPGFTPDEKHPLVFHMHGHYELEQSMVLTEDDYLDFLANSNHHQVLPPRIQQALTASSVLFVGYRLADWNFRVLFRRLMGSMESGLRKLSVAVQLQPEDIAKEREKEALSFLDEYFKKIKVRVFWGTAEEFAQQLRERWSMHTADSWTDG